MTDDKAAALDAAVEDLYADETRAWAVLTGKPDDTVDVHITPPSADDQRLGIHPPYLSFAARLVIEAARQHGTNPASIESMLGVAIQRVLADERAAEADDE